MRDSGGIRDADGADSADGRDASPSADLSGALERFAAHRQVLVCLDFDGCVAELVPDADAARPVPATAAAIEALADLDGVTVAYVSGRPLETLRRLASPPPGSLLIGSHGAEADLQGASPAGGAHVGSLELTADQSRARTRLLELFEDLASEVDGAWVEHKPAGAGMHVRRVPDEQLGDALLDRARVAAEGVRGAQAKSGKRVLEAVVVQATKGEGIERLRAHVSADAVFFAGDDVTDEHGFAVLREGDVGVKVGPGETAAGHRIDAPEDLAAVLREIVRARDGGTDAPRDR
ncbi:MAG: trehalose-phosphatase [Nesterenkonia sp.]|nr:trehalose-phosphatase [Nesterenkonia sp.]